MTKWTDLYILGIVGFCNLFVLFLITCWRTFLFFSSSSSKELVPYQYKKRIIFYGSLILASICDIPMYIGFIWKDRYILPLYAFHKFQVALLFSAYSITISDWINVLYDIREDIFRYFQIRRATLLATNVVLIITSFINFIYCFIARNLDEYLDSWIYLLGLIIQIVATFVVNILMLSAGLKLAHRIQGVTGNSSSRFSTPKPRNRVFSCDETVCLEFQSALRCVNVVMITCTCCIFSQITLLILNYTFGYADNTSASVGPVFFYWTFYSWIPLWGPVLAMLYLTRSSPAPARKKIDSFKEDFLDGEEGSLDKDSLLSSSNGVSHLGHIYDILDTKSLDRYDRLVDEGEVSGLGEIFTPEDAHHLLNHADRTGESATSQYPVSEYYFRDMKDMVSPQYNLDYEYILESPAYQPPDNQSLNS